MPAARARGRQAKRRVVVGIDFGTSNSGAAYALVGEDDNEESKRNVEIEVVKDWPNAGAT